MPRAKAVCSEAGCLGVVKAKGKCVEHQPSNGWTDYRAKSSYKLPKNWTTIRLRVLRRDGYTCRICGVGDGVEVDHRVSVSAGGSHDMSNLRAACRECHARKSRREAVEGRRRAMERRKSG